ncbi:MAG: hypothetical protein KAS12_05305, partial [Candidatus Aenigmarchaeota archaeon]|nr:hypothetical protein [Candidatus Aenigmarchaeota archaeon]
NYQSLNISVNISDNWKIDTVWANITGPLGSVNKTLLNTSGDDEKGIWFFEYIPILGVGMYDVVVYVNDSSNNIINSTQKSFQTIGTTTAKTQTNVLNINLTDITYDNNGTVKIEVNVTNTGLASMYDAVLEYTKPTNAYASNSSYGLIAPNTSVLKNITFDVTRNEDTGNKNIYVNVKWKNPDNTYVDTGSLQNNVPITITPNTYMRIIEPATKIITNYTISDELRNVGFITLQNYGNTQINDVQYNSSGNITFLWIVFNPITEHNILKSTIYENITISLNIPEDTPTGYYESNITLNNSDAFGGCKNTQCLDSVKLKINLLPKQWNRDKKIIEKTVEEGSIGIAGYINITNNKTQNIVLDASSN